MTPAIAFINHVLTQQGWARDTLKPHAGRSVRVEAAPVDFTLTITPEGLVGAAPPPSMAESGSRQGPPADVTLSVPLSAAPWFALDPERAMKQVRIEGDAEFAQTLSQLARELRWDAEEDLSRVTGDIAAYKLMQGARALQAYAKDATQRATETGAAYLIDEDPTLVRTSMNEQFAREVSTLRDDTARLEKRLELQEARRRS